MSVQRVVTDVSGTASYPTTPQVIFDFSPTSIILQNEDTADDAYVSFDGVNDHAYLPKLTVLTFKQNCKKVWLKRGVAGSAPTNIAVIAQT